MIDVYSDVIQFQGSHYDFGYMQGERLREGVLINNRKKQWFSRPTHRFHIDVETFRRVMEQFSPSIYEEIIGLQEALELPLEKAIRLFGGYYVEYTRSGCSIFMTEDYMVRNYDNAPLSYEGRFVLYKPTDSGYATIGPTMQITGRTDGMNEKGLVMGYNFINTKQSADGFMCNMIGRLILENCATVNEAIDLLQEIPHRQSFSYPLLDPNGKYVVVEASPRKVVVHENNVCTNHFEKLTEENRYRMEDSLRRQQEMSSQQQYVTDAFSAYKMMNDSTRGVFSTSYGSWSGTLHTALYLPKERQVGLALGGDRLPFVFSFDKWLEGEQLQVKRINGKLETDTPFANMISLTE